MKNLSINLNGKLPNGLVALYNKVISTASELQCDILVVGAMARDLVLVYGYGAKIERGTRDVDFAIQVKDWNAFAALTQELTLKGFIQDKQQIHKLHFVDASNLPWEIDILPFGAIADSDQIIKWPPDQHTVMTVVGFIEAHEHAIKVQINNLPETIIRVATPAALSLLKLIAWLEREPIIRNKDAQDINYLIQTYSKIPEIFDAIYENGHMQTQDWDEEKATAMQLGQDTGCIASLTTRDYLQKHLFSKPDKLELLSREMQPNNYNSEHNRTILDIYIIAFNQA